MKPRGRLVVQLPHIVGVGDAVGQGVLSSAFAGLFDEIAIEIELGRVGRTCSELNLPGGRAAEILSGQFGCVRADTAGNAGARVNTAARAGRQSGCSKEEVANFAGVLA